MNSSNQIAPQAFNQDVLVNGILDVLEKYFKDYMDKVSVSKEVLLSGTKTEQVRDIEETLKNPLKRLAHNSVNIHDTANKLINSVVEFFLKGNAELIEAAYRSSPAHASLRYSIVLKEDTTQNRLEIFKFFDNYELLEFSQTFPVYFEFIPREMIASLTISPGGCRPGISRFNWVIV